MFKIGDFSQMGQVSIRTLRLYDELGLLRPAQIDKFTSYRFYTLEQLPRLNRILALKDLGLSLEQIGDLLKRDLPAEQLRGMLMLKQAEIETQMQEMQSQMRRVEARLKQIEREGQPPEYDVVIKSVAAQTIASVRGLIPQLSDMVGVRCHLYEDLYRWLTEQGVQPLEPEMAIYHNSEYVEQDIDMEAAVPIEAAPTVWPNDGLVVVCQLPAVETMATVIHQGDMWGVGQAITALYSWIGQHGYAAAGPYRELHLFWRELEIETAQFDHVSIEMQIPIVPL
ncbi:MAG: MerR family transcriptional regulator [Thermoflexales bacterium]|nr:MerR family transcriptional regulator [Thermoflexales bacterium]